MKCQGASANSFCRSGGYSTSSCGQGVYSGAVLAEAKSHRTGKPKRLRACMMLADHLRNRFPNTLAL